MEEGLGPGVVAAVGELSQEEAGELSLQYLVVGGIVCLVSGALALVFPVTVMCCPGFPGCFPESRHWVLSLGAVVIRHSLHVMSSVGRAQPGCP